MRWLGSDWNEDQIETLKRLWANGLSAAQIGAAMGITRNAVLGKRKRLGLPERLRPPPKGVTRRPKEKRYARRYSPIRYQEPAAPIAEVPHAPLSVPCSLLELDDARCRWPFGNPGEAAFHFCGADTSNAPYCAYHARIAFEPRRRDVVRRAA